MVGGVGGFYGFCEMLEYFFCGFLFFLEVVKVGFQGGFYAWGVGGVVMLEEVLCE